MGAYRSPRLGAVTGAWRAGSRRELAADTTSFTLFARASAKSSSAFFRFSGGTPSGKQRRQNARCVAAFAVRPSAHSVEPRLHAVLPEATRLRLCAIVQRLRDLRVGGPPRRCRPRREEEEEARDPPSHRGLHRRMRAFARRRASGSAFEAPLPDSRQGGPHASVRPWWWSTSSRLGPAIASSAQSSAYPSRSSASLRAATGERQRGQTTGSSVAPSCSIGVPLLRREVLPIPEPDGLGPDWNRTPRRRPHEGKVSHGRAPFDTGGRTP